MPIKVTREHLTADDKFNLIFAILVTKEVITEEEKEVLLDLAVDMKQKATDEYEKEHPEVVAMQGVLDKINSFLKPDTH